MIDLHAISGTPGAAMTLGAAFATLAVNDLCPVAGIPMRSDATLLMWGGSAIVADTIANMKLISQDCIDPINGENFSLGTASLKNLISKYTNIPFKSGGRIFTMGTNTGVTAALAYTLDYYGSGPTVGSMRFAQNQIQIPQTLNTDVALTWTTTPFAPATPIPNGKYALLGIILSKSTGGHGIRFQHADFGQFLPGFLLNDSVASAILGVQEGMNDAVATDIGFQFCALSELLGKPSVPVFTVSNAATGLNIQSVAAANTDTPVVTLNLAKVG